MPKLRLSDAIALNGMTKPQGRGAHSFYSKDTPCALGGALQAIGKPRSYSNLQEEWPWVNGDNHCPVCDRHDEGTHITRIIWHLNDTHEWSRQQIAEWVSSIEPADEPCSICGEAPCKPVCEATVVRHCEDSGELCGKTCVEGSYLCEEHHVE